MEMKNHMLRIMVTVIFVLTLFSSVLLQAEERERSGETVLAEYRDGVITRDDLDEEFEKIPFMYRSRFSTLAGQQELLNSIIISRLFYLKARELGVDQREDVLETIENSLKDHYAMEYRKRDISDQVNIPQSEIRDYHQQHIDRFTESPNTVIRYIMPEDNEHGIAARRALDSGIDFIDVMNQYSTNSYSKRHQGFIRNIRSNGYIAGVGMDDVLDTAISEAPLNTWTGPITTDSGIHIFQVTERTPQRVKPIDEVREEIISRIKPAKEIEMTALKFNELKDKYGVQIDNDLLGTVNLMAANPSPEQLQQLVVSSDIPELKLSVGDVLMRFRRISQQERAQMNNPEYQTEFINDIITNELFAYEARQKGYGEALLENPEVQQIRRNVILTQLFNELVVAQSEPAPADIEAYYDKNISSFSTREQRTVQYFLFDSNRAARSARNNVNRALREDDQDKIRNIIQESLFTDNNGIISNINREPNIPKLGQDDQIYNSIWNTNPGDLSRIKRNEAGKYFFVRIMDHFPAHTIPLEEAEERIVFQLTRELREKKWSELQEELKQEYQLVSYPDRLAMILSARELFDLAEEAMKRNRYRDAIQYYDQIIENHKNNDDDYKALFMKAFVIAEELQNPEEAVKIFKHIVADFPPAELHESAEYMIRSIEDGFDVFEDLK